MTTVTDPLLEALRYLAERSQFQGEGFNRIDAPSAEKLAARSRLTPKQTADAHRILRKYAKQLSAGGIDYASIPDPVSTGTAPKSRNPPKRTLPHWVVKIPAHPVGERWKIPETILDVYATNEHAAKIEAATVVYVRAEIPHMRSFTSDTMQRMTISPAEREPWQE